MFNNLKFLNPTCEEKLSLVLGDWFPSSTSVPFFFLLKLLCAIKGELSRLGLLCCKKCLASVLALQCLLGDEL